MAADSGPISRVFVGSAILNLLGVLCKSYSIECSLEEFPSQPPTLLSHPPKNYQLLKVLRKS